MRLIQTFGTTLAVLLLLFVSGGATCSRRPAVNPFPPPPPVNFGEVPTLQEVAAVVNRTSSIQQLSTNTATVEMEGVPKLSATMNLSRHKSFRLRASVPLLLGSGVDMGSNDQMFWLEIPEGMTMTKTLYYARHDQYQQQLSRAMLPVDPTFVMDALGLVQIDPATVVQGPIRRTDGKLEIRSTSMTPSGMYQRVLFVEPTAGYVTDQMVYDPSGTLVAQASSTNHVYYDAQNCVLPHQVSLQLKPNGGIPLAMQINVSSYTVNQLLSGDPNLFVMPQTASQAVDLAQPNAMVSPMSSASGSPLPAGPSAYSADASEASPLSVYR
ncbi:hypothetical protein Pla22_39900 [Rubripirellula amarantea]|uniref:DUF4292 domain-containing protein n=1 Tax=Rubripirellula amarantea TaxID=2527999 RepID=A0A5C5WMH5_9BACT|nr:hypothetical protein [Rubripirellula amarantea]TWT51213.1 hypothetical protein Pla22_39900 [Rubripirellula amarantea]